MAGGAMGLSQMSASDAATTSAVRVRSFLSRREVATLLTQLERLPLQPYTSCDEDIALDVSGCGRSGGSSGSGDGGGERVVHVTKYLNTDGIFRRRFRGLRRRVMAVAAAVSAREGWGSAGVSGGSTGGRTCGGGGGGGGGAQHPWGTCWRRGCGWKPRVCEYHTYEPGGRLTEEGHTDVGSLVTVDVMLQEADEGGELIVNGRGGASRALAYGSIYALISHSLRSTEGAYTEVYTKYTRVVYNATVQQW